MTVPSDSVEPGSKRFSELIGLVLDGDSNAVAALRTEYGGRGSLSDDVIEAVVKLAAKLNKR